ncbi:MAG: threonine--tRNA ligase [Candidatus Buchananbacteria bacterium RIFCSPHIGHO2_02_FULL_45_11b]|uniref:Threonine--tRNA ligase n=1 Tax=Candidatus Buchananbacteria bacterium RIFCSPHIGHO2_02_FULL_45_11b TaxID=1797541 RepID=A0A1G1YJ23_9BACT|nr:MAG: threonine--tRNA ligase [Candidatus Buchananbacteria bacterium RIFCSPHIGHO2_02_FULL_45_11b]
MKHNLQTLRHSASHVLAEAVLELFPEAKLGIGPAIEDGFYYDFDLGKETFAEEDLAKIEKKMKEIIRQNQKFEKYEGETEKSLKYIKGKKQPYKLELGEDLKKEGEKKLSFYRLVAADGKRKFVDLCAGPHLDSTKEIGAVKLLRLAGAYWKGSEKNKMLQRVYGTAFAGEKELSDYLALLAEAKKRDHRVIGADQQLFFFDDLIGKGLALWLPKGVIIRNEIEKLAVELEERDGYIRVITPHLAKEELYVKSGHLPYYKDSMYPGMTIDDGTYYLKAMNCPHHHTIYNHNLHSYRELPVRIAEYGTVYRNELSGTLAGLLRVRGIAQNDAHIYCRGDQIKQEFKNVMALMFEEFKIFGLKDYSFRLSLWDPEHTEKYINEPKNWEYAERIIREALKELKVDFIEAKDEAAFYGPKIDVQIKNVIGREETMSTIQLDFAAKGKFNLCYTDETGKHNNEVFVIHRAPLSSHERFLAILIEHYAGVFPVWLCPHQVQVVPVGQDFLKAARKFAGEVNKAGIRVWLDDLNETVGYKIRKGEKQKVPYMVVIGQKEAEGGDLQVRLRSQKDVAGMSKGAFIERVVSEIKERK